MALELGTWRWCRMTPQEDAVAAAWPSGKPSSVHEEAAEEPHRCSVETWKALASATSHSSSMSSGRMLSTASVSSKKLWTFLFHISTRTQLSACRPWTSLAAASMRALTFWSLLTLTRAWIIGASPSGGARSLQTVRENAVCRCSAWLTSESLAERKGSKVTEVLPHLSTGSGQRTTDLKRPTKRSSTLELLRFRYASSASAATCSSLRPSASLTSMYGFVPWTRLQSSFSPSSTYSMSSMESCWP
mmetsp:Transcript_115609/g.373515  ORF Transcript_115609/g.373515 Transcript_115609/m.373515 type:complete len:246 (+) Transcript_115609:887-1624(+)